MENDNLSKKVAWKSKRLTFRLSCMKYAMIAVGIFFLLPLSAQKINKDYLFYPQDKGILYFIYPQKGFRSPSETDIKGLEYDITYLSTDDSLTLSFTYVNKEICKPEAISFISPENRLLYKGETLMLFVQPLKQNWKHRGMVKIPYAKAAQIYETESPFRLQIHTNRVDIHYQIRDGKWEKQHKMIKRILEIIANNN